MPRRPQEGLTQPLQPNKGNRGGGTRRGSDYTVRVRSASSSRASCCCCCRLIPAPYRPVRSVVARNAEFTTARRHRPLSDAHGCYRTTTERSPAAASRRHGVTLTGEVTSGERVINGFTFEHGGAKDLPGTNYVFESFPACFASVAIRFVRFACARRTGLLLLLLGRVPRKRERYEKGDKISSTVQY